MNLFKQINSTSSQLANKYTKIFHRRWFTHILYGFLLLCVLAAITFLNIFFMRNSDTNGFFSLKQIGFVFLHWNLDLNSQPDWVNSNAYQDIKIGLYNSMATLLGGMGMSLAAIAAQSLTKNSIAEGSTLGLVQSSIFGIVFLISVGITSLWLKYAFAMIFGLLGALILMMILFVNKSKSANHRIILFGLAIGVVFKTLTFIFKKGDQSANSVSYAYVLGGSESISGNPHALLFDTIPMTLLISCLAIVISLAIALFNTKGMNLLLIGEERAKNLGSKILTTKILNVLVIFFGLPAAVIVVGNMAFLGLFAIHAARWLLRSRDFRKVIPFTVLIGMIFAAIGLQLSEHIPKVNSGLWMTFIGAPYLIYIGIRGLK